MTLQTCSRLRFGFLKSHTYYPSKLYLPEAEAQELFREMEEKETQLRSLGGLSAGDSLFARTRIYGMTIIIPSPKVILE